MLWCDTKSLSYQPEDRHIKVEVCLENDTVWMTQKAIAEIYNTTPQNITLHIKNIIMLLSKHRCSRYYTVVKREGSRKVKRRVLHYNLDIIFNIAIRGQYFEEFNKLINFANTNGVSKDFLIFVPIKERKFGKILQSSLEGIVDIYAQFKVEKYIVDFYIPEVGLVIEYDEKHHKKQIDDDEARQKYVEEKLEVEFIRVNEGEEFQGLNRVIKFIMKIKNVRVNRMPNETNILIYQTEEGNTKIDVRLENETVWMTQKALAELYQSTKQNISLHIKNIFEEKELDGDSVVNFYLTTAKDGKNYKTKHYNLEMVIAIGYRVRSHRGTQFRQWATERLNEYLVKGFTMDDDRLKEMRNFGQDYFDELLERIRDIRASEKRFYQKITDIYATSVDYDSKAEITQGFFATVQNKLHFAIHGQTAAELIEDRAKGGKENMGLTSWKGDKVRKQDVTVAKNYLSEKEVKSLNRIVAMYLDYAEDQAERQQPMYMSDWIDKLNAFLKFNDREILENAGNISKAVADKIAIKEYEKFNQHRIDQKSKDDFDRFIENNNLKK